jgi:hypothetical protein
MASGLTHIMLTKELQNKLKDGTLKNIFADGSDFLQVGAIAPDIPYASIVDNNPFSNQKSLADSFHYEKTNQIPLQSLAFLKKNLGQVKEELHYHLFSFYLGYISHVFIDGIIHPFVRDKVGNYQQNKAEHRNLEMQLDVLLMHKLTERTGIGFELNYTNIHDELLNFAENEDACSIAETFSSLIQNVYNINYAVRDILGWIKGLYRLFEMADGKWPAFFRKSDANTFLYKNYNDIDQDAVLILKQPKDRMENFLKIKSIGFFEDCLPQFYAKYIEIAEKAYNYVYNDGVALTEIEIPNINLDTGRLISQADLNNIPYLWKNH